MVFNLDATNVANVVSVYKGATEVGVPPAPAANAQNPAPASFLSDSVFAIGPPIAGVYPYTGLMDNFEIQGTVPEPGSIVLLIIGLIGMLAYAWRKRK